MLKLTQVILMLGLLILVSACNNGSIFDNPVHQVEELTIVEERQLESHREIDILYPTTDTTLGGTLYLPEGPGPHPVILFHFGSNAWERSNIPIGYPTNLFRQLNIGLFAYDRRGLGQSGGRCCEADIERLSEDVIAGANALAQIEGVDSNKIGALGFSQGGWVVPRAAALSDKLAFIIVGSGGGISMDEEALYSDLTGDDDCKLRDISNGEIDEIMAYATPGGYTPHDDLVHMSQPAFWYYGEQDTSHPIRQVIANLNEIKQDQDKNWQIELFANANHEFLLNAGPCDTQGEQVDVFSTMSIWLQQTLELETLF